MGTIDPMGDELKGIEEDVRFNWAGASSLEGELRSTAGTLDSQISQRNGYASHAREEWRGLYSRQFAQRMRICSSDAGRLSDAMTLAANQLKRSSLSTGAVAEMVVGASGAVVETQCSAAGADVCRFALTR